VNNKIYIARIYIAAFTQNSYRGDHTIQYTQTIQHLVLARVT